MRLLSVRSNSEDVAMHATSGSSSASVNHGTVPQSPWHSPVPYLFGGLAAMLGLIAFSLLILACSYWRHSGEEVDEEKESRSGDKVASGAYEEKFLVIMAGENLPRFLATRTVKKCTCGVQEGKMLLFSRL
ncbi:BnaA03g51690D [Brassica napus]|uniref:BnaA03g51690D protein n=1 Tax=Brassica napus TaxID=3708 RepID=A0A078FJW3_BRANA|nr:BnaA03g51690D [Brassica napus]